MVDENSRRFENPKAYFQNSRPTRDTARPAATHRTLQDRFKQKRASDRTGDTRYGLGGYRGPRK